MSRDTGIADRLRAAGLRVVEVAGWQTRGSDVFNPRGSVDHHTACGPSGNAPSLWVVINGRLHLPGPLCNVLIARDNTCYVIAAGRANHAGLGGWHQLSGNSSVYGVERENVGTSAEPWRDDQTWTAAVVHAALIRGCVNPDSALVCRHKEWAPTRKIDTHSIDGDALRGLVGSALNPSTPINRPEIKEELMYLRDDPAQGGAGGIYSFGADTWRLLDGPTWEKRLAEAATSVNCHPFFILRAMSTRFEVPKSFVR